MKPHSIIYLFKLGYTKCVKIALQQREMKRESEDQYPLELN